ncbi:hypothetical protein YPPY66_3192 [Yersinia pestis PY-66]|uniref:Uncharacterized protein n=2 Tax=Yersinia pestis TaxID=632 RepID=A0AAV3BJ05_YERPE|nr:hypothetical protein YPIP275_0898 [Yersinia pestis biovar Orientalis str. IP275]EDR39869.1 hypothetical protein YpF1991016_1552 [Yersinia pestis biovar Orientalis str. F1991016]EDR45044.1 hypothetical protein YpE1979001_1756 [Yersinia pestis biovar Antiqua str. E1979001]EDR49440.1 hypothetical protein YpB42003004_0070 [Yersinia pestis biovar Antiqua str. B42003004]EDR55865.1 hypothetical protein YpMG051020_0037 [Yersinia pestis biovar Orientalis str. MG05-1020]EDR66348.1 hypothetical protei
MLKKHVTGNVTSLSLPKLNCFSYRIGVNNLCRTLGGNVIG